MSATPVPYRVRLNDVDAAGVVFAARICAIAHECYEEALAAAGLDLAAVVAGRAWGLPLVRLDSRFLAPLRHGDRVQAEVALLAAGDQECAVRIRLLGADGRPAAVVDQHHVCIALPARQRCALPPELRAALSRLPAAVP